jgi:hypothetical protein
LIVGNYTSQLQFFIQAQFITPSITNISLIDSQILNYLRLQGTYYADVPLMLPSVMVLDLSEALILAA